ncbi:sensor histidine kinase [Streptomyces sp. RKND-216]|uniref:sensor histidine kinase n=1 Tax=Streptomyces sp. RKND-216 TaxID=2562581 RepID=UPI00109E0C20|nr:sensor histidine kinase [Streptomyces sp. RKND-216]THA23499.1 sensor histidine kinase [Streptomyces sp. RKND-216]
MHRALLRHRRRGGPPWRRLPGPARPEARIPWRSALFLAVFTMAGAHFAAEGQTGREPLDLLARLLLLAGPALLLLRLRLPRFTVYAVAGVCLVYLAAGYPYGPVFLSVVVAAFSAVVSGRRVAAWTALGALWAGHLAAGLWLHPWLPPEGGSGTPLLQALVIGAWLAVVVPVAELARVRREQWAREREERVRAEERRADEERLRIARELHDVLAHSVSVINVQAGVGLALLDSDPEQARSALTTIKSASKEALGEVRQVLDTLRTPGAAPRAPAPGLERLPELAEHAAGAGLRVTTETVGEAVPLPPGADLAAFRIVQEALTNVVRHSAARTARVRLVHGPGTLEITVDDDGPPSGADGPDGGTSGGNGLAGMRERAAVLGGGIEAGPRPDGGFRVRAVLPTRPAAHRTGPGEETP